MLLTLTTHHRPATDLGYLLNKHPDRFQQVELPFGMASVFFPEASPERCTAALMLDIDPIGLVRGKGEADGPLSQYVNDRPYVASSFLSVALARTFGTAMSGTSKDRQELADSAIPLEAHVPVVRSRGGAEHIHACFEPLGYQVNAQPLTMEAALPEWGDSPYFDLNLRGHLRLRDLLAHLYVLLPALDGDKHYYVGEDEVSKLLSKAGPWLAAHPEKEWITSRYLKRQRALIRSALARLMDQDETDIEAAEVAKETSETRIEQPLNLNEQRMGAVLSVLRQSGARRVLDLGCGEGKLIGLLLKDNQFDQITGVDVASRSLEFARERLHLDRLPPMQQQRVQLLQGALTYRDRRLEGFDAACVIEVIEHIDASRLPAFERTLFGCARPRLVVVTTPNVEYNARFESMTPGSLRHPDHRFEWNRAEFRDWADGVASRNRYRVRYLPVGPEDESLGPPTQMAIFERE